MLYIPVLRFFGRGGGKVHPQGGKFWIPQVISSTGNRLTRLTQTEPASGAWSWQWRRSPDPENIIIYLKKCSLKDRKAHEKSKAISLQCKCAEAKVLVAQFFSYMPSCPSPPTPCLQGQAGWPCLMLPHNQCCRTAPLWRLRFRLRLLLGCYKSNHFQKNLENNEINYYLNFSH